MKHSPTASAKTKRPSKLCQFPTLHRSLQKWHPVRSWVHCATPQRRANIHWRQSLQPVFLVVIGEPVFSRTDLTFRDTMDSGPKKASTIIIWNTGSWETNAASDPVCFEHTKIGLAITCGTNVIKLYNRVSRQTRVINKGQQRYTYLIHFFNLCTTLHQPKRKRKQRLKIWDPALNPAVWALNPSVSCVSWSSCTPPTTLRFILGFLTPC